MMASGRGVATSGNKVYVGSRNTQEVFEYAKNGGAYTLVSTITPSVAVKDFGHHVSVSGSWMAVSAPEYGPSLSFRSWESICVQKTG